mmetsp:Transcript_13206/g.56234  ORF Transcript_13206/g.56234 Transcript_13206/m.56234 type:complete len:229 (-) Transcript_13206:539-1225(-)
MRESARIFSSSASSVAAACASCLLRLRSRIFIRNAISSFALWYASTSFFVSRSTSRLYTEWRFAAAAFSSSSSFAHSLSNVSSSKRTPGSTTSHSWYSGYRVATGGLFRSRNVDDAASAAKPCVSRCDFETRAGESARSPLFSAFAASNQVSSRRISRHCSLASRARTRGSYPRRTHSRRNGPSLNRNANSGKARSRIAPAVFAVATSVAGNDSNSASCAHTVRISNA